MTHSRTIGIARLCGWKSVSSVAVLAVALVGVAGCAAEDVSSPAPAPSATSADAPPASTPPAPAASNPGGSGETASQQIDNSAGGSVELPDGTSLDVPAGALPPGVDTITVTSSPEAAPADYVASTPAYVFGPDGAVFLKPLKISIPVNVDAGSYTADLTVLWSRISSDTSGGFDMVPTEFKPVAGSSTKFVAVAEVTHFSRGFCGKKYTKDPRPSTDPYKK
jgi:hypothetical protein